jgi:hypothetical protein
VKHPAVILVFQARDQRNMIHFAGKVRVAAIEMGRANVWWICIPEAHRDQPVVQCRRLPRVVSANARTKPTTNQTSVKMQNIQA